MTKIFKINSEYFDVKNKRNYNYMRWQKYNHLSSIRFEKITEPDTNDRCQYRVLAHDSFSISAHDRGDIYRTNRISWFDPVGLDALKKKYDSLIKAHNAGKKLYIAAHDSGYSKKYPPTKDECMELAFKNAVLTPDTATVLTGNKAYHEKFKQDDLVGTVYTFQQNDMVNNDSTLLTHTTEGEQSDD